MQVSELNHDWSFRRDAAAWTNVDLPHNPFVADRDGRHHWFGDCEYRRALLAPALRAGERLTLFVGAAMHSATVLLDGRAIGTHAGGYLPFEIELTPHVRAGATHELLVRIDNRDHPDVPPGKPYDELDFCWYGGLYRGAELRVYPAVHLTEEISAGEVAGGGVFFRTLSATRGHALASVRAHVRNAGAATWRGAVRADLFFPVPPGCGRHPMARIVAVADSPALELAAGEARHVDLELHVENPALWSIARPQLHDLVVSVLANDGAVLDSRRVRVGLRTIAFSRSRGFELNGERVRPRGTNRHQEFPLVGYAAGAAAQWRDARRIKEAGFDYVRCSHYPPSPAFLDACDALGIVVMDAIPGWQFIGGEAFRAACCENARQVVRRDRNHACVVLWELSLNETAMDEAFMARLRALGHEEFPGDQMYVCGWIDAFDVFIHSRQHGRIHSWRNGDRALVVAEYGDWEFYAANEGFDQKTGAGVLPREGNSRKFRADGERGLLRQAENFTIALADTMATAAVCDGQWAMFDYARGYDPLRAACGVMDLFRLPKFAYYFYRSQRSPHEVGAGWDGGPVVFVASHWLPDSARRVTVFSNCDEVELALDGRVLARRGPARTAANRALPHPPFFFDVPAFAPGTLRATGFIAGQPVASHAVATPGAPAQLALEVDGADAPDAVRGDFLLVHARVLDAAGALCVRDTRELTLRAEGDAAVVGPATVAVEAGVASFGVALRRGARTFALRAVAPPLAPAESVWRA